MKSNILNNNQNYINRWIISYADFVTILLGLFMALYALSQLDINHLKIFSNSIDNAFYKNSTFINKSPSNLDEKSKLLKLFKTTEAGLYLENAPLVQDKELNDLKKQLYSIEKQIYSESASFEKIKKTIENDFNGSENIKVIREPRGLLIRLNDTVLFDKDSDIINVKALKILDKIAVVLKNEPNSIKIEGYADSSQIITDKFSSGWELSTARAISIAKHFVNEKKLRSDKFSVSGYGQYSPVSKNVKKAGLIENTRIDIVLLSLSSKIFEPEKT